MAIFRRFSLKIVALSFAMARSWATENQDTGSPKVVFRTGAYGFDSSGSIQTVSLERTTAQEIESIASTVASSVATKEARSEALGKLTNIRGALQIKRIMNQSTEHEVSLAEPLRKADDRLRALIFESSVPNEVRSPLLGQMWGGTVWTENEYEKFLQEGFDVKNSRDLDYAGLLRELMGSHADKELFKKAATTKTDLLYEFARLEDSKAITPILKESAELSQAFLKTALEKKKAGEGAGGIFEALYPVMPRVILPHLFEELEKFPNAKVVRKRQLELVGSSSEPDWNGADGDRLLALLKKNGVQGVGALGKNPRFQKLFKDDVIDAYKTYRPAVESLREVVWDQPALNDFSQALKGLSAPQLVSRARSDFDAIGPVATIKPLREHVLKQVQDYAADPRSTYHASNDLGSMLWALRFLGDGSSLNSKGASFLSSVIKNPAVNESDRQNALEILARSEPHFEVEMMKDKGLVKSIVSGPFSMGFLGPLLEGNQEDRSLVRAGILIQDMADPAKIKAMPLCSRICDLAEKVKKLPLGESVYTNGLKDPQTWNSANENLRRLFLYRVAKFCPKSVDLEKTSLSIFFDAQKVLLPGQNPEQKWQKEQERIGKISAPDQLYSQGIYSKQFILSLLGETGAASAQKDLGQAYIKSLLEEMGSKDLKLHSVSDDPLLPEKSTGSYWNTYAYTTSLLHVVNYPERYSPELRDRARARLVAVEKSLRESGASMKVPYNFRNESSVLAATEEGSYGRNLTFYLSLYMSSQVAEERDRYRGLLEEAVKVYLKNFPDALLYGKSHGVHAGQHQRAPYYFFGTIPYLTSALKVLRADTKADQTLLTNADKWVGDALLSSFDETGYYSAGTRSGGTELPVQTSSRAKVYNNVLIGLSLLALGDSCLEDPFDRNRNFGILATPVIPLVSETTKPQNH